ncbi:hypothetical protein B0H12DRAFT_1155203 [Mycena haematopus]|nr:hypothetical protein B0H12DRAFT_1155203 [Mycena haematopus]
MGLGPWDTVSACRRRFQRLFFLPKAAHALAQVIAGWQGRLRRRPARGNAVLKLSYWRLSSLSCLLRASSFSSTIHGRPSPSE